MKLEEQDNPLTVDRNNKDKTNDDIKKCSDSNQRVKI